MNSFSMSHIISIAFGSIIGWGSFLVPSMVLLKRSGLIGSIIGIFIGSLLICGISVIFSKFIIKYKENGGVFIYAYRFKQNTFSFLCGWLILLSYLSIVAINLYAIPVILRFSISDVVCNYLLYDIYDWRIYLPEVGIMVLIIMFFLIANLKSNLFSGNIQLILSLALFFGTAYIYLLIANITGSYVPLNFESFSHHSPFFSILFTICVSPYLFVGFDAASQLAGEYGFEKKSILPVMLLSIVCGCFCYFLITILSAYSLPSSYNSSMIFDWYIGALVDCYGGKFNLWILLLTVLSAALSGVNGFLLAASRLIAVMSTYHYLPKFLSYKNQHGAPVNALIMIALVAFLFIWLGRNLVVFITVDVSSVGILFSYFIICFIGIKTFKSSYFLKKLAIILLCIFFILLLFLIIPFSPLAIGTHSIYILIAWIIIGFFTKFFNMEGIEYDN